MPDPGAIYYSIGHLAASRRAALSNKSHFHTLQGRKGVDDPPKTKPTSIQDSIIEGDMGFDGDLEGMSGHFGLEGNLEDFKTMENPDQGLIAEDMGMSDFDPETIHGPRGDVYLTPESELPEGVVMPPSQKDTLRKIDLQQLITDSRETEAHQQDVEHEIMRRVVEENIRNIYPKDKDYIKALEAVDRIYQLTDNFPRHTRLSHLINFRWFRYLTIPEALLYDYLLRPNRIPSFFTGKLSIIQEPTPSKPLIVGFSLISMGSPFKTWHLHYDLNTLKVAIYEGDTQTGAFRFVIRNHKLEEVEGFFGAHQWTIDPVWSPTEEGVLKEEHLKLGPYHATLIHHENELEGHWLPTTQESKRLQIHELPDFAEDKNKVVTAQQIQFGDYDVHVRLIFSKGVLIPLEGGMVIRKK